MTIVQQPTQTGSDDMIFGATYNDLLCAAIGGLLISISSSIHLWTKGRVTGMSGILNGIITLDTSSIHWKSSIFLGMITIASATLLYFNDGNRFFDDLDTFRSGLSVVGFVIAGFLTGVGTKLGNGCTSGHGVCGLPRFSIRSFIAVCSFMFSSILTANIMQYFKEENEVQFLTKTSQLKQTFSDSQGNRFETELIFYTSIGLFIAGLIYHKVKFGAANRIGDCLISWIVGALFSAGLIISGMVNRRVVLGFLVFNKNWNPSLALVLAFAVLPNILTFYLIQKEEKPLFETKFSIPNNKVIDKQLVIGALIFGLGWGIGGMCPGPSFCMIPTMFSEAVFVFFIPLILGNLGTQMVQEIIAKRDIKK